MAGEKKPTDALERATAERAKGRDRSKVAGAIGQLAVKHAKGK